MRASEIEDFYRRELRAYFGDPRGAPESAIIDLESDFVYNDALLLENMQQLFTITGNVPSICANRLHADTHCSLLFTS